MTAQGGDLLAWLDNAIGERERMAQESVEQATVNLAGAEASSVSVWRVIERPATGTFVATCDQWDRVAEVVPTYGGAHAEHIAANDPASVLRRCAADRKLIAEVRRTAANAKYHPSSEPYAAWAEAMQRALELVAEGYGWTGQTPPIEGDRVT
ncbi:DUF6221 family protein [Streptomyces prasinopilosus]|uniref:DUF6221 family protein n=1 Tax=Streptomyces prasinopilosus TaxID=67344 RepID=UPI0006EB7AEE|nr:DUF6221 family protein [Streptomyces prasinopilosus]